MRILIKALACSLIVSCVLSLNGFYGACRDIREEVFRLHIIANSDSTEDQELKLKVRDRLLEYTKDAFKECRSKEEAIAAAKANIRNIRSYAQKIVYDSGFDYTVDAYVTNMNFDTRIYDNLTLPAGEYDALRIVIGSAGGHNWWCVLFPVLCIPASTENDLSEVMNKKEEDIVKDSDEYEVGFKIVEVFEFFCSLFG